MTLFKNLIRKEAKKDRTIILDTSALNWPRSMEIIDAAEKVIILTGTIDEIDNLKTAGGVFGNNLRTIARKSREDEDSKKFVCVPGYEKYSYQDKNIVDFCKKRKNRNTTILTSDNNLCNLAKAYKIEYIFIQAEEKPEQVKEDISDVKEEVVVEEKEEVSQVEEVKEVVAVEERKAKKHIHFNESSIYIDSQKGFYAYNFLETAAGEITEKLSDFEEEDFLYEVLCSKKKQYMKIVKYRITKNDSLYDCVEVQKEEIYCINEIFRLHFSDEVNDELLKIFKENCT